MWEQKKSRTSTGSFFCSLCPDEEAHAEITKRGSKRKGRQKWKNKPEPLFLIGVLTERCKNSHQSPAYGWCLTRDSLSLACSSHASFSIFSISSIFITSAAPRLRQTQQGGVSFRERPYGLNRDSLHINSVNSFNSQGI